MLIVTGTPRSGTSMWMQILVAAGFEAIGEPFPGDWHALLSSANPDGYWESQLLGGVYYRTNPHPLTGAFLFPEQTRFHAVKILVPGLLRSDLAYIDRVVATVREPRQFAASRVRLRELYESHFGLELSSARLAQSPNPPGELSSARLAQSPNPPGELSSARLAQSPNPPGELHEQILRHELPPALEWWVDNFALLRDLATRRYAAHVCSYQSLIEDPERAIGEVLRWLDRGDLARAVAAVRPERQTQHATSLGVAPSGESPDSAGPLGVEDQDIEVFDELYDHVHRGRALSAAFLAKLNDTDVRLRPRLLAHEAQARVAAARAMLAEADAQSDP